MRVFRVFNSSVMHRPTDGQTVGRAKPLIELRVRNKKKGGKRKRLKSAAITYHFGEGKKHLSELGRGKDRQRRSERQIARQRWAKLPDQLKSKAETETPPRRRGKGAKAHRDTGRQKIRKRHFLKQRERQTERNRD